MSVISQKNNKFISDNSINVRGSILENDIDSSIKNDGQFLYVDVPDLSKVFKESTPLPASVKLTEDEFALVPSLFGPKIENILNKVNLYRLLSSGISSYIDSNTLGSYDELINSVEITNKGEENIRGVGTYHYTINPDKQLFKNLLTKIVEKFAGRLSDIDYENLKMIISSTSVSSFDVWVGKGDNTIYQYNIKLDVPMTKILGFEDKSIGDNTLGVSLKVTYFDFNVPNEIISPEGYIDSNEFVKNTKLERMKEKVQSFSILANNLQKVEKKYGTTSNTKGSCMAPVSQSLFSPTGHPKASILQVSDISSLLNDILGVTNGIGSCYSTPTAWSFAIPLSDNYDPTYNVESYSSFYCVDNKGSDSILTSLPSSVSCQTPTAN